MALKQYSKKRNLRKSPEPKAVVKKPSKKLIYVIHRHAARNLHYDLRLEHKGVLLSWAIPKEPPKTAGIKRLAIRVEDHPVEYAKFHGKIPEGMYGAGKVEIWDKGSYELLEYSKNKLIIYIKGKKLKGEYALVLFRPPKNWLFFRVKKPSNP